MSAATTETRPLLFTGAAGILGRWLRPRLIEAYGALISTDIADLGPALPGEETVVADLADAQAVDALVARAGRILHFGGISYETTFDRLVPSNIVGTYNVFEAARRHGVGPIVYASSNHAIGFYESGRQLDTEVRTRPDSLYGVTMAFKENLASLYYDKYGVESAGLRIGTARPDPIDPRHLSTWQSYEDLLRQIEACFAAPKLGRIVMYGVSANDRSWWSNALVGEVDYRPQDNAEAFAGALIPNGDTRDPEAPEVKYQGGPFVSDGYAR
ncbi:NAD(P)-dependent oxidoreductase [Bosea sp. 117]|uniref:NAD-dependent epimerase/dehydratase family protein n=1 Tax=Bosea sp. 117 TaxID=1125973 RepID=UPI0004940A7E|nr:NAD(P)-dependent oxidoreductase [Bosea sp. 117]